MSNCFKLIVSGRVNDTFFKYSIYLRLCLTLTSLDSTHCSLDSPYPPPLPTPVGYHAVRVDYTNTEELTFKHPVQAIQVIGLVVHQ